MNKDIRLNQKATLQVIDDLVRAQFIKASVVKDGAFGRKGLATAMTEDGTKMVRSYANALRTIRNPTKRKIDAFNGFLVDQAISYIRAAGWEW